MTFHKKKLNGTELLSSDTEPTKPNPNHAVVNIIHASLIGFGAARIERRK